MIDSQEISVIVQGGVSLEYTPPCLKSIRQALPLAQIILSTSSSDQDIECLESQLYDVLVRIDDPGALLIDEKNKVYNNINRQLATTKAGLAAAQRKFALKFRTDMILENTRWMNVWGRFDQITPSSFFRNRVLICDYYTRNPRVLPIPFHPSDWLMFGLTEDLKRYYDTTLEQDDEILWFQNHRKENTVFAHMLSRYAPEQYLCLQFIKRFRPLNMQTYYDATPENIVLTERFLAENMVVLDYQEQLKIQFSKYHPNRYRESASLIHYRDWKVLYRRYCQNSGSFFWFLYKLRCQWRYLMFSGLRKHVVRILQALHLKEPLKRMLGRSKSPL